MGVVTMFSRLGINLVWFLVLLAVETDAPFSRLSLSLRR